MKVKATKRKSEAADSLHGEGHSSKISKVSCCSCLPWHRVLYCKSMCETCTGHKRGLRRLLQLLFYFNMAATDLPAGACSQLSRAIIIYFSSTCRMQRSINVSASSGQTALLCFLSCCLPLQTNAAAAGVASAHHVTATAASPSSSQAAKQLLALQIEAKEKAVKLMKKLAAQKDPAKKALLQQKLDKLLSQAAPAAAAAAGTAASPSGGASSAAAAGVCKQHRPQPLAGITSVLANTPAEQVRQHEAVVCNVCFLHLLLAACPRTCFIARKAAASAVH
jgi:hypothetical protein